MAEKDRLSPEKREAVILALAEGGSYRGIGRKLGIPESTVRRYAALFKGPELVIKGTSILSKDGVEVARWDKTTRRGRLDEDVPHIPDPKTITKISSLYDASGEVIQQWIAEKPSEIAKATMWEEWAKALAEPLPRAPRIMEPTDFDPRSELMALYPIGDHHLGMLAWKHEVGESYDLDIGENLLTKAIAHLVGITPACPQALVAVLGDFLHYDSFETVTPTNRNPLDADGRYPKMVRAAIRTVRRVIEMAAVKHAHVRVIIEIGNHDLSSSIFLMEALHNIYEDNPRITIDTSPRHFHYFQHGKTLIATHHGHGVKPTDLPLLMAQDQPKMWGETAHRYWLTGHYHKQVSYDLPGCLVEIFGVLPPADAWAANQGYRPERSMKAIMYHAEYGEVARYTVNPSMLEEQP